MTARDTNGGRLNGAGAHGVVVCLLAQEVAALETGFRLGRLLGQLEPSRLEILVFPDSWTGEAAVAVGGRRRLGWSAAADAGLLASCRDLTRALGGSCPVAMTEVPAGGMDHAVADTEAILHNLAARLIGDFWLDPNS